MNPLLKFARMIFSGWGGQSWPRRRNVLRQFGHQPGSERNWEELAGDVWLNSTVGACLTWLLDELPQSTFRVQKARRDGTLEPLWSHQLTQLLDRPNDAMDGAELWQSTLLSYLVDGNAYWVWFPSLAGIPAEVWPVSPDEIEPAWPSDGSAWVSHYVYSTDAGTYALPPERVVHFKDKADPSNPRKGLGRVKAVLREITSDNEVSTYTAALMKNLGQWGQLLAADGEALTEQQAEALTEQIRAQTTGDGRFSTLAVTVPIKATIAAMTPEQMRLDRLPKPVEAKICANLGVSPMVTGLPSSADFATFANGETAQRAAWSRIQAIQTRLAQRVRRGLLPYFDRSPAVSCGWDWSDVPALQADAKLTADRATVLFEKRLILRNEGREQVGLDPLKPEFGDVFADGTGPGAPEPDPPPPPPAIQPPPDPSADPTVDPTGQRSRRGRPFHRHRAGSAPS